MSDELIIPDGQPADPDVLDVGNAAMMADWLRTEVGRGRLAGILRRDGRLVHCPREGEDGYVPLSDDEADNDGPAQVQPVDAGYLQAKVQYTYRCVTYLKKSGEEVPAIFPERAARIAYNGQADLRNVRSLNGVVHTPIVRADGTILSKPGYDKPTGLLYLPEPGLAIPRVPARPSPKDVKAAVDLLDEMIAGFDFTSKDCRANYLGALLTPALRGIVPPPYKMIILDAHQPGSGKTLLANIIRLIHGGVFRAEMPEDDAELRKQISSILTVTTGPVVVLDNVSGVLKSSTLSGLLTTRVWDDRPLGRIDVLRGTNDRLWIVTGNNLALGGDIPRRTIAVRIDPGVPDPHLRTDFAIADLESWVVERRGRLIAALLTLVRVWCAAGRPPGPGQPSSDGYAGWRATVDGILAHAKIPGEFDSAAERPDPAAGAEEDWHEFLRAVSAVYGDNPWTVRDLLARMAATVKAGEPALVKEILPGDLAARAARDGVSSVGKSLGRWCMNHRGRWVGDLALREFGDGGRVKTWRVVRYEGQKW